MELLTTEVEDLRRVYLNPFNQPGGHHCFYA